MWATLWLTLTCLVGLANTRSDGPPLSSCTDMIPQHNVVPQQTLGNPSPYTISISPAAYLPGSTVTVTVATTNNQPFRGFFVQARRLNDDFGSVDEPIGRFNGQADQGTQYLDCSPGVDTAWAHSTNADKLTRTATWIAPSTNEGPLRLRMSVVQVRQGTNNLYWTDMYSQVIVSAPIVQCPSSIYSSFSDRIVLPAPKYAGFNGPVTFTYSQPSGNTITLNDPDLPYHTILGVTNTNAPQFLNIVATDGTSTRTCQVQVFAFAAGIPTVTCPTNNVFLDAQENFATTINNLEAATARDTFLNLIPVSYFTSPTVILSPNSPTPIGTSQLSGTFNLGTNYIFAYTSLDNGYIVACFYTVNVVGLQCPNDITQSTSTVQWFNPEARGFSNTPQITYSYTNNNQLVPIQLVPAAIGNGQQQFTFSGGTSSVTATAFNGISTATCTYQVNIQGPTISNCPAAYTNTNPTYAWNAPTTSGFTTTPTVTYTINGQTINPTTNQFGQLQYVFPGGQSLVQVTATDNSGNQATCSFNVQINQVATISNCPAAYTNTNPTYVWNAPTTSGFTTTPTVTYSINGQTINPTTNQFGQLQYVFPGGQSLVQVTATDNSGNQATCSFNVQINQVATISNCPAAYTNTNPTYAWNAPTTSGFTTTPTVTYTINGQTINPTTNQFGQLQYVFPGGQSLVQVTATDNSGNQATCSFNVQINQVATISNCPAAYTNTNPTYVWNAPTTSGFTTTPTVTYSINGQTINPTTNQFGQLQYVFPGGQSLVQVTATDNSGNQATCSFNVQINQVATISNCPAAYTNTNPTYAWNAPTTSGFTTTPTVTYTINGQTINPTTNQFGQLQYVFPGGQSLVQVTASDNSGNQATCSFNVQINQVATISNCPAAYTNTNPTYVWNAPTTSGFTTTPTVTYTINGQTINPTTTQFGQLQYVFPGGQSLVQVTATDNSGNQATCSFNVQINQVATISNCPAAYTNTNPTYVWNAPTTSGFTTTPTVTYTINGQTINPTTTQFGQLQYVFPGGQSLVQVTATDNSGNQATCSFNVQINQVATISNCPAAYTNTNPTYVWNAPTTSGFTTTPTVTYTINGQTINPTTTQFGQLQYVFPGGQSLVQVTATDNSGNQATCSFNVQINQVATISNCPGAYTNTNPTYAWNAPTTSGFTTTPTVTYTINGQTINPTTNQFGQLQYVFPGGQSLVQVTATDNSGNQATCSFNVQINQVATISNCPAAYTNTNPTYAWNAPTTLGFATTPTVTYTINGQTINPTTNQFGQLQYIFPVGQSLVQVTANDNFGNQATCSFNVQINQAASVSCPGSISTSLTSVSWNSPTTANFVGSTSITYTNLATNEVLVPTQLNGQTYILPLGQTTTVRATATDNFGNSAVCDIIVNVYNVQCPSDLSSSSTQVAWNNPIASGFPTGATLQYTINGVLINQVNLVDLGNGQTSYSSFTPLTNNVVVVTASDDFGNTDTCSFNVEVTQAPTLSCPAPITTPQQNVFLPSPTPSGFVGQPTITYNINGDTTNSLVYTFNLGSSTTVLATAVDNSGNTASCTFDVNVINVICPAPITSASTTVNWNNPTIQGFPSGATLSYSINGVTPNPGPTMIGNGQSQYGGFVPGTSNTVRVTATDNFGNSDFCDFTVVISAVPSVSCPATIVSPSSTVSWNVPTVFTGLGASPTFSYSIDGNTISPQFINGQPRYTFTPGTQTTVRVTATDASGNIQAVCDFSVNILQITCPSDIVQLFSLISFNPAATSGFPNEAPTVVYTINNNLNNPITISPTQLTSGQLQYPFDLGSATTVTATATDGQFNTISCSFTVYVLQLQCPDPIISTSPTVQWDAPTPSGFPSTPTVSYSVNGGQIFPSTSLNGQPSYSFAQGVTMVAATATDNAGNTISCNFIVTYNPPTAPTVNCPGDLTIESTGDLLVSFTPATAFSSNNVPLGVSYSYSTNVQNSNDVGNPITGTFPIGTTTVTALSAPDSNGLTNFCQFDVTVAGMICPSPLTLITSNGIWVRPSLVGFPNANGVTIDYVFADTNAPFIPTLTPDGRLEYTFPPGTTTVRADAADGFGNTASCQFLVTFNPQLPTITCPNSQSISSQQAATVTFSPPATAIDSQGFSLNVFLNPSQTVENLNNFGGTFPLGTTSVSVATDLDSNGLSNSCSFQVTVQGLQCPVPISSQTGFAQWADPIALGFSNLDPSSITYTMDGSPFTPTRTGGLNQYNSFPAGQTTIVRATATDSTTGNVATCVFPITVQQASPPTINCPQDQTVTSTSENPAFVSFQPATAFDSSGNVLGIATYSPNRNVANFDTAFPPHSGTFPVGTTTITVTTSEDGNGLTSTCAFRIAVIAMRCPTVPSVSSSTVTFNAPSPLGFPDPNNVFITYAFDGNSIVPTQQNNNQLQYNFPSGRPITVEATAMDALGNRATCSFTFTTPSATVQCPFGPFTTDSNQISVEAPTVVGFGPNALMTFSSGGTTLGQFLVGTSPVTLIGLNLGTNIVNVEVSDGTGNVDSCIYTIIVEAPSWGPWSPYGQCTLIVNQCEQTRSRVCNDPNPNDFIACVGDNFQQQACPFGSCGVASWDPWTLWSPCTRTCGTGSRSRTRVCNDPITNDNDFCIGDPNQTEECNTMPCVDWTAWAAWSACTVTCNGGTRTRERRCIDTDTGVEQPFVLCGFDFQEVEPCNNLACPPDPVWLQWSPWSDCSARCNGGIQERTRLCSDPNTQDQLYCDGQTDLTGIGRQTRPCNIDSCPEPEWYQWGPWTACSTTCNRGFRWRTRTCFDPFDDDQDTCIGEDTETDMCNDFPCPVATWTQWGTWGGCSATCGTAVRTRYRDCDDPNPLDLDVCLGSASSTESCYREPCPFPIWQSWTSWSPCTSTCGGGTRQRTRVCEDTDTNPDTYCSGSSFDTVTCNTLQCQEATWTFWTSWGSCSETCGSGIRTRQRTCQNPVAGQTCSGNPSDSQHCYIQDCIDIIWLNWGPWTSCSVTCGGGSRHRERLCSHPDQSRCYDLYGIEESVEEGGCNQQTCDVPYWDLWTEWSPCSASCGGGSQFRTRNCHDPYPPPFDVVTCEGDDRESRACSQIGCPLSQWQRWGEWSDCSADCNGGVRQRMRECYNPSNLAPPCPGASTTVEICNSGRCPEYWDVWGAWGQCSTTCGPGIERRDRSCVDPNPEDGIQCVKDSNGLGYFQTRHCDLQDCAGWSQWMEWAPCTVTCGTGIRQRFRTCSNPNPFIFGNCPGGNTDTDPEPCNTGPCPQWNNWGPYGDCSETCGGGTRQRIRTCYDPDRTDDAVCEGSNMGVDPVPCNAEPCDGPIVAWSAWSPWTGCSRTCGLGLQQRVRTCNDPDRDDQVTCENGDRTDSRVCNGIECVFPEWNEWQPWTCSVTCGGGVRARFRTCDDPYPDDEDNCLGVNIEQDPFQCNTDACPVAYWNEWGSWYECSASCGGGTRERRRTCYVPPTLPPGSFCNGIDVQPDGGPCNPQTCPVIIPPQWNNWGPWDECTVSCGGGIRERTRDCNDPDPFDFLQCQGDQSERDPTLCNREECPEPPIWNEWQPWGGCSQPCGGGEQVRIRTCYDEQPNDGRFCAPGNSIQSQDCNTQVCAAWSPWNTWTTCSVECGGGERRRERNCNSIDSDYSCSGVTFETSDCNPENCPRKSNIGLIVGLIAAALLLAAIVGAICLLLFCRRRPRAIVYQDQPPTPLPSPPPSPRVRRVIEEVELVPEKPKTRWVARRVPGVRAVVREEEAPSIRIARTVVRPALYVDGSYNPEPRYVRSVGDRVLLDGGRYDQRRPLEGISNSFL